MKRALILVGLLSAGCTLLTHFDPEGQPCDPGAAPAMQCLSDAGYFCVDQVCTKSGTQVIVDAGTPPLDAGTVPLDAGTTPLDAGTTPLDAGTTPLDAGKPDAGRDGG